MSGPGACPSQSPSSDPPSLLHSSSFSHHDPSQTKPSSSNARGTVRTPRARPRPGRPERQRRCRGEPRALGPAPARRQERPRRGCRRVAEGTPSRWRVCAQSRRLGAQGGECSSYTELCRANARHHQAAAPAPNPDSASRSTFFRPVSRRLLPSSFTLTRQSA